MNEEKIYTYLDGSSNKYVITHKSVEYTPIKPEFSSSGIYNGGDYMKKEISKSQFEKIVLVIKKAIGNKKSHIKNRVKASGLIIIEEGNDEETCILNPGSEELANIEEMLHSLIKN